MRSQFTDQVGVELTKLFDRVQVSVDTFVERLQQSRPNIFDVRLDDQPSFHFFHDDGIYHCYFVDGRWYCKA